MLDLEERIRLFDDAVTILKSEGDEVPDAMLAEIVRVARVRQIDSIAWLISLTQVPDWGPNPSDYMVATLAIIAISEFPGDEIIAELRSYMGDIDNRSSQQKTGLLMIAALTGSHEFDDVLTRVTSDANGAVRDKAEEALETLRSKSAGIVGPPK